MIAITGGGTGGHLVIAKTIAMELKNRGIQPDYFISSTALRAKRTATVFAETFNYNKNEIETHRSIYEGWTTAKLIEKIHQLSENMETVLFFGHNPNFHHFVFNLSSDFNGPMPTCSTVSIIFDVDKWSDVEERQGKTEFQIIPKKLR